MLLEKIKDFFKKIFRIGKIKNIDAPKIENEINSTEVESNSNFKESIKPENNEEYRIKKLQKEFKEGNINAEDINSEDKDLLIGLYIKQIKSELNEIIEYQNRIANAESN